MKWNGILMERKFHSEKNHYGNGTEDQLKWKWD